MILRAVPLVLLLLLPAAARYLYGSPVAARDIALGAVLAFYLGILARPLAPFGWMLAVVYMAASVTANLTDGVAALIVALAAPTGAASSLGYHRALLAVLAAALIGSSEPATAGAAARHGMGLLAGCLYGYLLVRVLGQHFQTVPTAVHSRTALSYSVLLAVLVVVAWFTARAAGLTQGWWLPLTVAALGEPWLRRTPRQAVLRLALAMAGTLLLLAAFDLFQVPVLPASLALLLLLVMLSLGRVRGGWQGFLLTPVLVLLVAADTDYSSGLYVEVTLIAFALVASFAVLGKWVLWTLRPDAGHAIPNPRRRDAAPLSR
jgi:hypothetical protein